MLINGKRALAYTALVTGVSPMNADRLESVDIQGWHVVCGKGEFKVGDLGVFIEVDSLCPEVKPFTDMDFLVKKHFKVKTQKIRGVYSQGLFMPLSAFGLSDAEMTTGEDLTERLNIIYIEPGDNTRKSNGGTPNAQKKVQKIQARHPWTRKVPKTFYPVLRWLYRKELALTEWPSWVVKTDEERVQNLYYDRLKYNLWTVTEKLDGTSVTFTIKRRELTRMDKIKKFFGGYVNPFVFLVCSRNVVFDKPGKQFYYDTNVYVTAAEQYRIESSMRWYMHRHPHLDWVTLQGEIFGAGIQKRDYGLDTPECRIFNYIDSEEGRVPTWKMKDIVEECFEMEAVPIIETEFALPDNCDALLKMADGKSMIDGGPREGLVFRNAITGKESFKTVSNKFLEKYH